MAAKATWQKTFENLIRTESVINLSGNTDDKFSSYDGSGYSMVSEYLNDVLRDNGYYKIHFYNPVCGLNAEGTAGSFAAAKQTRSVSTLAGELYESLQNSEEPVAWVIEDASYLCTDTHHLNQEALNAYLKMRMAIDKGGVGNRVIFIYENEGDTPRCFANRKSVVITKPDQMQRKEFISFAFPELSNKDAEHIADITDGLKIFKMEDIFNDVKAYTDKPDRITLKNAVNRYVSGYEEDPWLKVDREKLGSLEDNLNDKVRGQKEAVHFIAQKIKEACTGVTNIVNGIGAPKGSLVFAGVTGVGKTETAKALCREMFGAEDALIRIDANEYREEFNCERIIGAPPGYVGYEAGGQLTNAVKENPFAIILVDEAEKAHPVFWQYFMTVIQDGRLTSGKGETVSFNNCFIIFTTNLGALEASACGSEEEKKEAIYNAIEKYFTDINRKEIFGRLKHNIVTFREISDDVAKEIVEKCLHTVCENYMTEKQVKIIFEEDVFEKLKELAGTGSEYGGRDVRNRLNGFISESLTDIHINNEIVAGTVIDIKNIRTDETGRVDFEYELGEFEIPA